VVVVRQSLTYRWRLVTNGWLVGNWRRLKGQHAHASVGMAPGDGCQAEPDLRLIKRTKIGVIWLLELRPFFAIGLLGMGRAIRP